MAKGSIKVGDIVAITATVRKRVTEDRVSVLIPSYHQPHSIVDTTPNISSGQKIELTGEVLRVDEDTVTVGGKDLGITVKASAVRLVTSRASSHESICSHFKTVSHGLAMTLTMAVVAWDAAWHLHNCAWGKTLDGDGNGLACETICRIQS